MPITKIKLADSLPNALVNSKEIFNIINKRQVLLFLDYDGTLAPIVSNPQNAILSEEVKNIIDQLSAKIKIAVVSGRDRKDVAQKVGLLRLIYAGSHGFDITGPEDLSMQPSGGEDILIHLDKAAVNLDAKLKDIEGVLVERKKYAIAVHYRNVEEADVPKVIKAVDQELSTHDNLKRGEGKKIVELKPTMDWHKGKAVLWLMERLGFSRENYVPVFIGDDITDEDALEAVESEGIGILVGSHGKNTAASFQLRDIEEVTAFLKALNENIKDYQGV